MNLEAYMSGMADARDLLSTSLGHAMAEVCKAAIHTTGGVALQLIIDPDYARGFLEAESGAQSLTFESGRQKGLQAAKTGGPEHRQVVAALGSLLDGPILSLHPYGKFMLGFYEGFREGEA